MKKNVRAVIAVLPVVGLSLLSSPAAWAHDCCHRGHGCPPAWSATPPGRGPAEAAPMYDPDTVTTLRGTVGAVSVVPARGGRRGGAHVRLESDGRTTDVHLGPAWFLEREGVAVAKGDAVEVTGSIIEDDGGTFLIAREIATARKVLKLRDERGVPAWAGRRP
jgi:hypothetical protein